MNIDCDPDLLHPELTPAVHRLAKIGEPAIPALVDMMLAESTRTRQRVETALVMITNKRFGLARGGGWGDSEGAARFHQFWDSLGNYHYDAPFEQRQAAVARWRAWIAEQGERHEGQ